MKDIFKLSNRQNVKKSECYIKQMATIQNFEDLQIWQEARIYCNDIYLFFKENKDFGFKDQIQRASVSIMNNIAEGFERDSDADFCRFLII